MTSKEIQNKIDKLASKPGSAMPESIRLQVEATREHTLALYEGALQTAKLQETLHDAIWGVDGVGSILPYLEVVAMALKQTSLHLGALGKTMGEFGVGVVQVPVNPGGEVPSE